MATINAIDSGNPIESSRGGTGVNNGASTFTMGGSTSFVGAFTFAGTVTGNTAVTFPTSGTLATTATANVVGPGSSTDRAIATWNGTAGTTLFNNSGVTITSAGDLTISRAQSGGTVASIIENTSNTANALSYLYVRCAGTTAKSSQVFFDNTTTSAYASGLLSVDGSYRLSKGNTGIGTNDVFIATQAGQITMPLQPAFFAYTAGNLSNVTGDGTTYTAIFDTATANRGSNYNTGTGLFTVPVTGIYHFDFALLFNGIVATNTICYAQLSNVAVSATTGSAFNPFVTQRSDGYCSVIFSATIPVTAGQTIGATITVGPTNKGITIIGGLNTSFFSGYLVC